MQGQITGAPLDSPPTRAPPQEPATSRNRPPSAYLRLLQAAALVAEKLVGGLQRLSAAVVPWNGAVRC